MWIASAPMMGTPTGRDAPAHAGRTLFGLGVGVESET